MPSGSPLGTQYGIASSRRRSVLSSLRRGSAVTRILDRVCVGSGSEAELPPPRPAVGAGGSRVAFPAHASANAFSSASAHAELPWTGRRRRPASVRRSLYMTPDARKRRENLGRARGNVGKHLRAAQLLSVIRGTGLDRVRTAFGVYLIEVDRIAPARVCKCEPGPGMVETPITPPFELHVTRRGRALASGGARVFIPGHERRPAASSHTQLSLRGEGRRLSKLADIVQNTCLWNARMLQPSLRIHPARQMPIRARWFTASLAR